MSLSMEEKSVKSQMRRADRTGARFALIIGEAEMAEDRLTLRRLADGKESAYSIDDLSKLIGDVKHARD